MQQGTRLLIICRLAGLAAVLLLTGNASAQESDADAATAALQKLEQLAGRWRTDAVEFLDPDGKVRQVSGAVAVNRFELDGRVLAHEGRLDQPAIETRGWYYWSAVDGQLHMGSVTNRGRYDLFAGGWQDGRLVMVAGDEARGLQFRMTHSDITADSYVEMLDISRDGGESWQTSSRQKMLRLAGSEQTTQATMSSLAQYTGHWQSDGKTTPSGQSFHFEYDLDWLDPTQTIASMRIRRISADAPAQIVFEGYKGRMPGGKGVYYHAVSPSGRAATGEVWLEGDRLVTEYDGWSADGSSVRIRDVFLPVNDDGFVSRTYLRRKAADEWRQIGEDHWQQAG